MVIFCVSLLLLLFSSRRLHTRFLPVSWARRCVQETDIKFLQEKIKNLENHNDHLQQKLSQLNAGLKQKKTAQSQLPSQLEALQQELKQKTNYISELETMNAELKHKVNEWELQFQQLQEQLELNDSQVRADKSRYFYQMLEVQQLPVSYTHLTLPTKRIVQISVVGVSLKKKTYEE
eukprot:TRINITY_DN4984_c0_g1_i1.p1 TRINITY_DN4984_c0_g1~~TRINITY_DN4984_c0_g1_i1.p1  ORF type:complete len:177 (+),score=38.50 TRINITY_DN4984_c0_g1_i1:2-532(+)